MWLLRLICARLILVLATTSDYCTNDRPCDVDADMAAVMKADDDDASALQNIISKCQLLLQEVGSRFT